MDHGITRRAFSLVEVLVVVALILILLTLTVPRLGDIPRAARVSQGAEVVQGALSNARMSAVSRNRVIEIRLISCADPLSPAATSARIRAIQLLEDVEGVLVPLTKPRFLPQNVIISDDTNYTTLANLAAITAVASDPSLPRIARNYTYRRFRARPDGSFNLDRLLGPGIRPQITIIDETRPPTGLPAVGNFATITIEPLTGFTRSYRP